MRRSKEELLEYILNTDNPDILFSLKSKLETNPFCGINQCYDFERFIFHILTIEERESVISHFREISRDINKKIHIFTTNDYYKHASEQVKYFLNVNSDYITILNKESEINEISERSIGKLNLSYISDIDLPLEQKGSVPRISDIVDLGEDIVSQSLADLYFRTIINYTTIFPEFIPLFIDFANNANVILGYKLNDIKSRIPTAGCLLDNSDDTVPSSFMNIEAKIYLFKSQNQFIRIFINEILDE